MSHLLESNRDHGDESTHDGYVEISTESVDYTTVQASIASLRVMSEPQTWRLRTLCEGFKAITAKVYVDDFKTGNMLFTLLDKNNHPILNGLIEQNGSAHT